jgi:glycosyltransferase involved in cell wall biosynthesis
LIFPALEDFGMAPVEVMSCGRPIIAFGKGGAMDTVVDGVTGVFAAEQTIDAFADAMLRFESLRFDPERIASHAKKFSVTHFKSAMLEAVADVMNVPFERARTAAQPKLRPRNVAASVFSE